MRYCELCVHYIQWKQDSCVHCEEVDTILFDYRDCPLYADGKSGYLGGIWHSVGDKK